MAPQSVAVLLQADHTRVLMVHEQQTLVSEHAGGETITPVRERSDVFGRGHVLRQP
ncbi:hypothetical protein ACFTWF_33405 [Rhodococcus sp. NPDC056960]|uniref:hypothetical protein n=1 Tax=Rhodococcus sp. NPDC056960 TaxID=3345982 RepID=UPI0036421E86